MDMNINSNGEFSENQENKAFKDYIASVRSNLAPISIIIATSIIIAIIYAFRAPDIYRADTSLKLSKPGGSILEAPIVPGFSEYGSDRFIANEIEILKSYNLRERVSKALIDSFKHSSNKKIDYRIIYSQKFNETRKRTVNEITSALVSAVQIEQKRGLDILVISAESESPTEAALLANIYAQEYRNLNLEINRNQLTFIRKFLEEQRREKKAQLADAEEILRSYQEKGGIVALDQQANTLIQQIAQFEAQKNAVQIDLKTSSGILKQYKDELVKQDPRLADYLESVTSESYIKALQDQIAEMQLRRDLAVAQSDSKVNITQQIAEYDKKLKELKSKLEEKVKVLKAGIYASSPEEVKALSQKIIEEEIKNGSLKTSLETLQQIVKSYDEKFNKLPKTSIELARFQRNRESLEKLYTIVEERYQEALINEQSQPGNAIIVDDARIPLKPSKPNRFLIILIGFIIGLGLSFSYIFVKNYFDDTIKHPDDLRKQNINLLAWIPMIQGIDVGKNAKHNFIMATQPDAIGSEAFRSLRTRVQFSLPEKGALQVILITSPAPKEGKTTISLNLAGGFALANKKTLLIDADLRRPRLHRIFERDKTPGLVNYLVGEVPFEKIITESGIDNLHFISSGTIPPNPAEMLDSKAIDEFIAKVRSVYDIIIFDTPPIISVADAEILAKKVDGTILVGSANKTLKDMLSRSIQFIKNDYSVLLGVVLNNFDTKSAYGSYYKYYYSYHTHKK